MRSLMIRGGIAVIVLFVLWYFTSRWCALLVDQVYTPRLAVLQSNPIGWNGTWLQFGPGIPNHVGPVGWSGPDLLKGGHIVDFTGPGPDYKQIAALAVDTSGRLVLRKDGNSFVFGSRAGNLGEGDDAIPAFAADPGDTTSATLDRSVLSWPAPLGFNFMTGYRPSWQRYLYYRLSWKKSSGARLTIVWRFKQNYDAANGWQGEGENELTVIELQPPPK